MRDGCGGSAEPNCYCSSRYGCSLPNPADYVQQSGLNRDVRIGLFEHLKNEVSVPWLKEGQPATCLLEIALWLFPEHSHLSVPPSHAVQHQITHPKRNLGACVCLSLHIVFSVWLMISFSLHVFSFCSISLSPSFCVFFFSSCLLLPLMVMCHTVSGPCYLVLW